VRRLRGAVSAGLCGPASVWALGAMIHAFEIEVTTSLEHLQVSRARSDATPPLTGQHDSSDSPGERCGVLRASTSEVPPRQSLTRVDLGSRGSSLGTTELERG
jgi:hypothetical protein